MSQFWQNRQARLQPAVPNDSTGVPGMPTLEGERSRMLGQAMLEEPCQLLLNDVGARAVGTAVKAGADRGTAST